MLLGPVMLWGWIVAAAFIRALVPGLDFLNALVVAACVTPTDPILAQAVVGGPWAEKHVPAHLRHMLQCESGCNDGAAFPFLFLALFLTVHRDDTRTAIAEWFYDALAYQIIFGTILGALIGWVARKVIRLSERRKWVDRESFVAQYVSLAIASMGVNVLLGSDDLLAAFACGTAFAWDGWFTRQTEDSNFSNIVDLLFNCATFIYIGALMPWYEFAHAADSLNIWRCFVLAICVLSLKRIPIILALWRWIPDIKTFREAMFSGHFGPIGVGAIFIATLGRQELGEDINDPPQNTNDVLALTIQPIVFFFVLCSITVHGLTIPFFAFSKRATTITRTWSRHPDGSAGDPGWLSRMRRFKTQDSSSNEKVTDAEEDGGGMSEIRRVLDAQLQGQLGVIGRGAIGGEAEREARQEGAETRGTSEDSPTDSARTRVGLLNTRTERDLEAARDDIDDLDDWRAEEAEDPSSEWGGEDTCEARQAREKARQRAQEQSRAQSSGVNSADADSGDLGQRQLGSMRDEEVHQNRVGRDDEYPCARSWLEGRQLLIEYSESRTAEPEVHVVDLSEDEAEDLAEQNEGESSSVAHAWLASHRHELDEHMENQEHHSWNPAEAAWRLVQTGALQKWRQTHGAQQVGPQPEETSEDRDERAQMFFAARMKAQEAPGDGSEASTPLASSSPVAGNKQVSFSQDTKQLDRSKSRNVRSGTSTPSEGILATPDSSSDPGRDSAPSSANGTVAFQLP